MISFIVEKKKKKDQKMELTESLVYKWNQK